MLEPIKKIQRAIQTDNGPMLNLIDQNDILGKQEQIIDRLNLFSKIENKRQPLLDKLEDFFEGFRKFHNYLTRHNTEADHV